jgi:hypothetical protein
LKPSFKSFFFILANRFVTVALQYDRIKTSGIDFKNTRDADDLFKNMPARIGK